MPNAAERFPTRPGAEAWSAEGHGARGRLGLGLIHGFTGSPTTLRPLGERLAARGFRVDLPRLPGHGTDHRDMARTRYADWRAEVVACVERLRAVSDRVFLVGLSMGGTLSVDVAVSAEPSLAGLVTINAQILSREGALVKIAPVIERLVPFVPASLAGLRKDDIAKPGASEHAYGWVSPAAGNSLLRELPRVREQAARLRLPILVAYSRDDHSVPPDNSRALLELVASQDKTELVLLRSYHVATLDYDLELLEERIAGFCDRVGGIAAEA